MAKAQPKSDPSKDARAVLARARRGRALDLARQQRALRLSCLPPRLGGLSAPSGHTRPRAERCAGSSYLTQWSPRPPPRPGPQ